MRRSGLILLSVSAVAAALVVAPAAAAAPVPTAPYNAVGFTQSATDTLTGGAATATGDDVHVLNRDSFDVYVTGTLGPGRELGVDLGPPVGSSFVAGTVLSLGGSDATHAGIVTNGIGYQCFSASGSLTVREAVLDDGSYTTLALDFDMTCTGGVRVVGFVRVNSTIGFQGLALSPGRVAFPSVTLGGYTDLPVTLTATGTQSLPYISSTTFGGADPGDFSVVGDDCKDRQLQPGESCTVTVRARPLTAGGRTATLVIVHDDSAPYEVLVQVSAIEVATGTYHAVTPRRILDTRTGLGGRSGPLGPNGVVHLGVTGGLAGPAAAVVLNLTVDRPTGAGYLTAFPTGAAKPVASSINFPAGAVVANLVTVPVGAGGKIDIYNNSGSTSVIADIVGWYSSATNAVNVARGGGYHPRSVQRLFDSRDSFPLPPSRALTFRLAYPGDQGDIAAMSTNITVVGPQAQGYVTAWNGTSSIPSTSTLNFRAGAGVVSNAAIVPTSYRTSDDATQFAVINRSAKPIDIVVDINGFFDRGNLLANVRYQPLASPTRIVDTRTSLGTTTLGTNTTRTVSAPAAAAGYDTIALDANITAVAPTNQTYVTVWPTFDDYPRPLASTLNAVARQTVANHAIAEVGFGNRFNLYNSLGTTNLLVDVSGTFELFPATPADQIPRPGSGSEAAAKVTAAGSQRAIATRPTLQAA